ncbi:MAG: enoyl-CoA hydratase-related protein [Actinobacteria bacterium]|nr:enoyl-CoA hydratase-related protein [Actinomycetota bacterium]
MDEILVEDHGPVRQITLNRPAKKNALTPPMYAELTNQLNLAAGDFAIRVVVICGAGSAFTAGNDIFDFLNTPPTSSDSPVMQFLAAIHNFPKPLIASVHGNAVGIGTTMLMHCDLVFAAADAKFQMPFVSLGLVPEAGSSLLFPRLAGHVKASEIFLTGRSFDSTEALEMKLINSIEADPLAKAIATSQIIANQPPEAVINTKALLKSGSYESVTAVMRVEGELFQMALESEEAQGAFMKFLESKSKG